MLLSLFCGPGGMDLGFEQAGYSAGLAFDASADCVATYNHNRPDASVARCEDIRKLTLARLDELWGGQFAPKGVIGGPPCQSFSKANTVYLDTDPRHTLPLAYAKLLKALNERKSLDFFVMENVTGLSSPRHAHRLKRIKKALVDAGFVVSEATLTATDYCTPQLRERLFIVGLNRKTFHGRAWTAPNPTTPPTGALSVRGAIGELPEPTYFIRGLKPTDIPHHVNHWCMQPRSAKFSKPGALVPGDGRNRSFKTLDWDQPSPTVAYGHREVHIHPSCKRRLSVFEAMLLQGFPDDYELLGTLSSQIVQVSEAVPPPMAEAIARSISAQTAAKGRGEKRKRAA